MRETINCSLFSDGASRGVVAAATTASIEHSEQSFRLHDLSLVRRVAVVLVERRRRPLHGRGRRTDGDSKEIEHTPRRDRRARLRRRLMDVDVRW